MLEPPSRRRHNFFAVSKLVLAAVAAAALVEIALPPELPAPTKIVSPQIDLDLENANLRPSPLEYSQDQINAYLTYRLISKKKALTYPFLTFVRATASFPRRCLHHWRGAFALWLFNFQPHISSRRYERGKNCCHKCWRLDRAAADSSAIMQFGDIIFADLWSALDRERKLIGKMEALNFHDGSVTITAPTR